MPWVRKEHTSPAAARRFIQDHPGQEPIVCGWGTQGRLDFTDLEASWADGVLTITGGRGPYRAWDANGGMIGTDIIGPLAFVPAVDAVVWADDRDGQRAQVLVPGAPAPPVIVPTSGSGTAGSPMSVPVTAAGAQPIAWSASGLPAGLAMDPATGLITGIPSGVLESGTNTNVNGAYYMGLFADGADIAAGNYEIEYVGGAIDYDGNGGSPPQQFWVYWPPAWWNGNATLGPFLWHDDLTSYRRAPGLASGYATIEACEAANAGQKFTFTHTGGQMGIRLEDPFGSNAWSSDNTGKAFTYRIKRVGGDMAYAVSVTATNAFGSDTTIIPITIGYAA